MSQDFQQKMQWCLLKHNIPFFFLLWETFCPRRQFKLPLIWPYFDRNLHQGRRRVRKGQEQNQGRGHHLDPGLVQDHQSDTEKGKGNFTKLKKADKVTSF